MLTERFDRLLRRMEASNVARSADLIGCTAEEVAALEARYGIRLPLAYTLYLRVMGHRSGRLFTCDHIAAAYKHVLDMTAVERNEWLECNAEDGSGPPISFEFPADALLIVSRLGDQFEFIRCNQADDSTVWYFNTWDWQPQEVHASVLDWLESWCTECEEAIADGYYDIYPEGTVP